ncbi:LysR substrate-binding domain-containing protein, partial [Chromobacterium piscinae]
DAPLPFLGYASNAYFRLMSDLLLVSGPEPAHLSLRYETDMAEGLKQMALAGHGLAFLPESSVAAECAAGLLTVAGGDEWSVEMEVRLYCD